MKKTMKYEDYIKAANDLALTDPNNILIQKDILSGRTDKQVFGYSMKEFLYHVQGEIPSENCRADIANVCRAFCIRHPDIGYVQGMNMVACFLLMFLQEENAFWVFTSLIEKILPTSFFSQMEKGKNFFGFYTECRALSSILPKIYGMKDLQQIATLSNFMEIVLPSLLLPLFVDILNFETVYHIISQLLETHDWLFLEKCTLAIFESIKEAVLEDEFSALKDYRVLFSRKVSSQYLSNQIQIYTISSDDIAKLKESFAQEYKEEWNQETGMTYESLTRITKFSKEEIEIIQAKFTDQKKQLNLTESIGLSSSAFLELINKLTKETIISFSEESHLKMFDHFDTDKDNLVDFKGVLGYVSLLLRGNIPDKIQTCLKITDADSKGYLEGSEVETFLDLIIRMAYLFHEDNENSKFETESSKFKEQALEICSRIAKFRATHVKELMQTEFIGKLQKLFARRKRKEAATINSSHVSAALQLLPKEYDTISEILSPVTAKTNQLGMDKEEIDDKSPLLKYLHSEDSKNEEQSKSHKAKGIQDEEKKDLDSDEGAEKKIIYTKDSNSTASKEDSDFRHPDASNNEEQGTENEETSFEAPIFTEIDPTSKQYQSYQEQTKPIRAMPPQPEGCKICIIF